ncbi:hypothetical protein STBA_21430 [Streptomyces sp. MP131-18]|nr:hypothetical protein STBA_21430 [Streptomyces sp. MP131-18]
MLGRGAEQRPPEQRLIAGETRGIALEAAHGRRVHVLPADRPGGEACRDGPREHLVREPRVMQRHGARPLVVEDSRLRREQRRDLFPQQAADVLPVVLQHLVAVHAQPGNVRTFEIDHRAEQRRTGPQAVGQDAAAPAAPPHLRAGAGEGPDLSAAPPRGAGGVLVQRRRGRQHAGPPALRLGPVGGRDGELREPQQAPQQADARGGALGRAEVQAHRRARVVPAAEPPDAEQRAGARDIDLVRVMAPVADVSAEVPISAIPPPSPRRTPAPRGAACRPPADRSRSAPAGVPGPCA